MACWADISTTAAGQWLFYRFHIPAVDPHRTGRQDIFPGSNESMPAKERRRRVSPAASNFT
jgi:hypothetical protein